LDRLNDTALKLAWLPGSLQPPAHSLTLVVKGCFDLVEKDKAIICEDADAGAIMGDIFTNDKPTASLSYANDLVVYKPKADLTLSGVAYPQPGQAGCRVTFGVGNWRKSLAIFNDRFWRWGSASAPEPFAAQIPAVPLTYENAYGGYQFGANPVGKGAVKINTDTGESLQPLPNIEHINSFISSPSQSTLPAGFGPLKDNWGDKTPVKGTYGDKWLKENFPYFPPDFDWGYFNSAPQDQQVAYLAGDEKLYFENLRPDLPQFTALLPAIRPRLFLKGELAEQAFFQEVTLRLDSLHVDMEKRQVNLVWRGVVGVQNDEFEEISHACVYSEDLAEPVLPVAHYQSLAEEALVKPDTSFDLEKPEAPVEAEQEAPEDPEFAKQMAKMFADISKQMKDAGAPDSMIKMIGPDMDSELFMSEFASHYKLDLAEGQRFLDEAQLKQKIQMREALIEAGEDPGILDELDELKKQQALEEQAGLNGESPWSEDKLREKMASPEGLAEQNLQSVDLAGWDLSEVNFKGADLTKANLRGANISGADFSTADLTEADLTKTIAIGAIFDDAIMTSMDASRANFSQVSAQNSQFQQANLLSVNFTEAILTGADFSESVLAKAMFNKTQLNDCLFEQADLSYCEFEQVTAIEADFNQSNLRECFCSKSNLQQVNFSGARLSLAHIEYSDLSEASLQGVNAQGINLLECSLSKIRAGENSNFSQAQVTGGTGVGLIMEGADLSAAVLSNIALQSADFSNSNLTQTVFVDCDMKMAVFTKASLIDTKLSGVNLFEAGFSKAKLIRADLSGSNLFGAEFFQASLQDTNLQGANLKRTKIALGMVELL
jgi:uncharacterized protein YjbI with pentapeptide repeats